MCFQRHVAASLSGLVSLHRPHSYHHLVHAGVLTDQTVIILNDTEWQPPVPSAATIGSQQIGASPSPMHSAVHYFKQLGYEVFHLQAAGLAVFSKLMAKSTHPLGAAISAATVP